MCTCIHCGTDGPSSFDCPNTVSRMATKLLRLTSDEKKEAKRDGQWITGTVCSQRPYSSKKHIRHTLVSTYSVTITVCIGDVLSLTKSLVFNKEYPHSCYPFSHSNSERISVNPNYRVLACVC